MNVGSTSEQIQDIMANYAQQVSQEGDANVGKVQNDDGTVSLVDSSTGEKVDLPQDATGPQKTGAELPQVKDLDSFTKSLKVKITDGIGSPRTNLSAVEGDGDYRTIYSALSETAARDLLGAEGGDRELDRKLTENKAAAYNLMKGMSNIQTQKDHTDLFVERTENLHRSHHVVYSTDKKTGKQFVAGWNGTRHLGFIYSASGDKVGTHEYANGARKLGKLGECFLRVEVANDGKTINKYGLDAFLDPLVFRMVAKDMTDGVGENNQRYHVKDEDAGYRFTHVNKRSKKGDEKNLDELKLETVGGHKYRFWEKAVSKFTGMNDVLHMKAVRANFASAIYDELRHDGLEIPEDYLKGLLEEYVLNGQSSLDRYKQEETKILHKGEVVHTVEKLTADFRKDEGRDMFAKYVETNMRKLLADVRNIRMEGNVDCQTALKDLLGDEADDWTSGALFDRIRNSSEYKNEIAGIEGRLSEEKAADGKNLGQRFKHEHKAEAAKFQCLLKGLVKELALLRARCQISEVEQQFSGLIDIAQNPANFKDGFLAIPEDKRSVIKNLLTTAILANVDKVSDEGVKASLKKVVTDGLEVFCEPQKDGTDFLALELQRLALQKKDVKYHENQFRFSAEILNGIARSAMEFVQGYQTHYEKYLGTSDYDTKFAEITGQTSVVLKSLTDYVTSETLTYLEDYRTTEDPARRQEIAAQYDGLRLGASNVFKLGDGMPRLEDLTKKNEELKNDPDRDAKLKDIISSKLSSNAGNLLKVEDPQAAVKGADAQPADGAPQVVDLKSVFDSLLRKSYIDYFRDNHYTGVDQFSQIKTAYDTAKGGWEAEQARLKDEKAILVNSVKTSTENKTAYASDIEALEHAQELIASGKNIFDANAGDLNDQCRRVREICKNKEAIATCLVELKVVVGRLDDEISHANQRIKEIDEKVANSEFKWSGEVAYQEGKLKRNSFTNYVAARDGMLKKGFDEKMVGTLGRIYAALTTFRPAQKGHVSLQEILISLGKSQGEQTVNNAQYLNAREAKKGGGVNILSGDAQKDSHAGGLKRVAQNVNTKASDILNALNVCVGLQSKNATFMDKVRAVYNVFNGASDASAGVDNDIKSSVASFLMRCYSDDDSKSLFRGLYDNWRAYLTEQHNQRALDLFDDFLAYQAGGGEGEEKRIVDTLKKSFAESQSVNTEEGVKNLLSTIGNLQEQIVSFCEATLKGVSTDLLGLTETNFTLKFLSGETFIKAKAFRNSLTSMTDAQLWKLCSAGHETADGGLPAEASLNMSHKAFRKTMEAICEYRFVTNSINAIKEAVYSFTKVLPMHQREFLELKDKSGKDSNLHYADLDYTGGQILNAKGLEYLKGEVSKAVDAVLAEESSRAAKAIASGDKTRSEDRAKLEDAMTEFSRQVSETVLKTTIVGEMYDLDTLYLTELSEMSDKVGQLFAKDGDGWLRATYPHIAKIYGGDASKLVRALQNGMMGDFCNACVIKNCAALNKKRGIGQNILDPLKQTIANEIHRNAPKQILQFLGEINQTLAGMMEEGKRYFLDRYQHYLADKDKAVLTDNASRFRQIEEMLVDVPERKRAALMEKLIAHAVERLMNADATISNLVTESLNYGKFESYRTTFNDRMEDFLKTNQHEFVKRVTENVNAILMQVKMVFSDSNGTLSGMLKPENVGAQYMTLLNEKGSVSRPVVKRLEKGADVDATMKANIGKFVKASAEKAESGGVDVSEVQTDNAKAIMACFGLDGDHRKSYVEPYSSLIARFVGTENATFADLLAKPGVKALFESCVAKVKQDANENPVRYYELLEKSFVQAQDADQEERSRGFVLGDIGAAMQADVAKLFFERLPRFIQMQERVEASIQARMGELEAQRGLLADRGAKLEWDARRGGIVGAATEQMAALIKAWPESVQKKRAEMDEVRQTKAREYLAAAIDEAKRNGADANVLRALEPSGHGFAYVDDLEVEDAVIGDMIDTVVNAVCGERNSPYAEFKAAVDKAIESQRRDFVENHAKGVFGEFVGMVTEQAKRAGLAGAALNAFTDYAKGILQTERPDENALLAQFFAEAGRGERNFDADGLRAFLADVGKAFNAAELGAGEVSKETGIDSRQLEANAGKIAAALGAEASQKLLLAALQAKFAAAAHVDASAFGEDPVAAYRKDAMDRVIEVAAKSEAEQKLLRFRAEAKDRIDVAFAAPDEKGGVNEKSLFKTLFGSFYGADGKPADVSSESIANFRRIVRTLGLYTNVYTLPSHEDLAQKWEKWTEPIATALKEKIDDRNFQVPAGKDVKAMLADLVQDVLGERLKSGCKNSLVLEIPEVVTSQKFNSSKAGVLSREWSVIVGDMLSRELVVRAEGDEIYKTDLDNGVGRLSTALADFFTERPDAGKKLAEAFATPMVTNVASSDGELVSRVHKTAQMLQALISDDVQDQIDAAALKLEDVATLKRHKEGMARSVQSFLGGIHLEFYRELLTEAVEMVEQCAKQGKSCFRDQVDLRLVEQQSVLTLENARSNLKRAFEVENKRALVSKDADFRNREEDMRSFLEKTLFATSFRQNGVDVELVNEESRNALVKTLMRSMTLAGMDKTLTADEFEAVSTKVVGSFVNGKAGSKRRAFVKQRLEEAENKNEPYQFSFGKVGSGYSGQVMCAEIAGLISAFEQMKGCYAVHHLVEDPDLQKNLANQFGVTHKLVERAKYATSLDKYAEAFKNFASSEEMVGSGN